MKISLHFNKLTKIKIKKNLKKQTNETYAHQKFFLKFLSLKLNHHRIKKIPDFNASSCKININIIRINFNLQAIKDSWQRLLKQILNLSFKTKIVLADSVETNSSLTFSFYHIQ